MNAIVKLIEDTIKNRISTYNDFISNFRKNPIESLLGKAEMNLFNERSIAYYFDKEIERCIKSEVPSSYFVSEAFIAYNTSIDEKIKAVSEIVNFSYKKVIYQLTREHRSFIPDAMIIIPENFEMPFYFIEYKVSDRFSFLKLAMDFLKYKYYSPALSGESAFVYVLFYKVNGRLKLRETMELDRILERNTDLRMNSLFYYIDNGRNVRFSPDAIGIINEILNYIEKHNTVRAANGVDTKAYINVINSKVRELSRHLGVRFWDRGFDVGNEKDQEELLMDVIRRIREVEI